MRFGSGCCCEDVVWVRVCVWRQFYGLVRYSHWRESGASAPYRLFPDKPYFRPVIETISERTGREVSRPDDLLVVRGVLHACGYDKQSGTWEVLRAASPFVGRKTTSLYERRHSASLGA